MFKKREKPRQVRQRHDSEEGNGSDNEAPDASKLSAAAQDEKRRQEMAKADAEARRKEKERKEREAKEKSDRAVLSFAGDDEEDGETFKIKKSSASKKMARETKERKKFQVAAPAEDESDGAGPMRGYYSNAGEYTAEKLSALRIGQSNVAQVPDASTARAATFIPDANQIHDARKRREMMRQMQAQGIGSTEEDFIPLAVGAKPKAGQSRGGDDSDDDTVANEDMRIQFGDTRKIQKQRQQAEIQAAYALEHGSGDESEDEIARWEREQIRKGGVRQPEAVRPGGADKHYTGHAQHPQQVASEAYIPAIAPDAPASAADVIARLRNTLAAVKKAHTEGADHAARLRQNLDDTRNTLDALGRDYKVANDTYSYFVEMRTYVSALIDCLDEKVPQIDACEAEVHVLLKERADSNVALRQQALDDVLDELLQQAPGGRLLCQRPRPAPSGTDEFGRDASSVRKARIRDDEVRRKMRRQLNGTKGGGEALLGTSSADEYGTQDPNELKAQIGEIVERASHIFDDAGEAYASMAAIAKRLEAWKRRYLQAYHDAFVSICLPKMFAPYVRLQMLNWDPLAAGCPEFEEMEWFGVLVTYAEDVPGADDDEDANLVPEVLQRVLVPKLTGFIEHVWDPASAKQTHRLKALLQRLADYPIMDPAHKCAQEISGALSERIARSAREDVCIPLLPKENREDPQCAGAILRLMRAAAKLVRNMTSLSDYVSMIKLQDAVLEVIVNTNMLPVIAAYGPMPEMVTIAEQIVEATPRPWFQELTRIGQLSLLERLRIAVVQLNEQAAGSSESARTAKLLDSFD